MERSLEFSPRTCFTCKHARYITWNNPSTYSCLHKNNLTPEISLVTGTHLVMTSDVEQIRSEDSLCGPEGSWYSRNEIHPSGLRTDNSDTPKSSTVQPKKSKITLDDL